MVADEPTPADEPEPEDDGDELEAELEMPSGYKTERVQAYEAVTDRLRAYDGLICAAREHAANEADAWKGEPDADVNLARILASVAEGVAKIVAADDGLPPTSR